MSKTSSPNSAKNSSSEAEPGSYTFFARQPVFDGNMKVWGYELLYRHNAFSEVAESNDFDAASLQVTAEVCQGRMRDIGKGKKILVNFSEKTILEKIPRALPPKSTVIQIEAGQKAGSDLLTELYRLKRDGYLIAVDDFNGSFKPDILSELCTLAVVNLQGKTQDELAAIIDILRQKKIIPIAGRLEDFESFEQVRKMGFALFQGFFFQKPQTIPSKSLASAESSRLRLLKILQTPNVEIKDIAKAVIIDAAISYRLLSYVNSAFFGFKEKITSIERAIMLLGDRQIRTWLRVIILSDISKGEKSGELAKTSVQRGKFFELCAKSSGAGEDIQESFFILGLFSLLEAMLGISMNTILESIPLDAQIAGALLGKHNVYRLWLDLVISFESGDWTKVDEIISTLKISPAIAATCYAQAMDWTNVFFANT